jgi:hypothetical protein
MEAPACIEIQRLPDFSGTGEQGSARTLASTFEDCIQARYRFACSDENSRTDPFGVRREIEQVMDPVAEVDVGATWYGEHGRVPLRLSGSSVARGVFGSCVGFSFSDSQDHVLALQVAADELARDDASRSREEWAVEDRGV